MEVEVWCILFLVAYISISIIIFHFCIGRWFGNHENQYSMIVDINEPMDTTYPFFGRIYFYVLNGIEAGRKWSANGQEHNSKIQIQCADVEITTDDEDVV